MTGTVEQVGPQRVQLHFKEMAPRYVLVPLSALPSGVQKGDRVELTFRKLDGAAEERTEEAPTVAPTLPRSQVIRFSY